MKRVIVTGAALGLGIALLAAAPPRPAAAKASPPQSSAYGKTLAQWMQIYWTWAFGGGSDQVGRVKLLGIPSETYLGGSFTYADPGILAGHLDVTLPPGTPFVLPAVAWSLERYAHPVPGYPDDPPIPAEYFTDPSKAVVQVYLDGKAVMDSTKASVAPYYFGLVPLNVTYPAPTSYGSIGAIGIQGVGAVYEPLSVGVHTLTLKDVQRIPPDPAFLNTDLYPAGSGVVFENSWTIRVSPK